MNEQQLEEIKAAARREVARKGGKARAKKMTKKQRKDHAIMMRAARSGKVVE